MNLTEDFGVARSKVQDVLLRLNRLGLDSKALVETFSRGGGPGGQKINKTANCVHLAYPPLDIYVRSQGERQRGVNRFLALRELVDRVEMKLFSKTSRRFAAAAKIRRRKAQRRKRAAKKYQDSTRAA